MNRFLDSLMVLFGRDPKKPDADDISPEAKAIYAKHQAERTAASGVEHRKLIEAQRKKPEKIRRKRWAALIIVNLLFVVSYWLDVQLVEGALTGSRFIGFHMADLNASLQVMLASKLILINLVIGTVTVGIVWWLLGGRTFCSWVCPYHLVSEWAEILHLKLAKKKIVKDHALDRRARLWLWLLFAVLALVTGYTVFESISPTGILSRALIYGPGIAIIWVAILLVIEIFYTRRAWCRYFCPIGLTYGVLGSTSPFKVVHKLEDCDHDGLCRSVCLVPHVLNVVLKDRATDVKTPIGPDCTRCGRCIDICPTKALGFKFKGVEDKS